MNSAATGSPRFAVEDSLSASDQDSAQRMLGELAENRQAWARADCKHRIALLDQLSESLVTVAEEWVAACCKAKGHLPGTPPYGEEWLTGPSLVARNLRLLRQSITDIEYYGVPQLPSKCRVRTNGQVAAPVFPTGLFDCLLFSGFAAEIWMEPEVTLDGLQETMAVAYRGETSSQLCLVLCAGNVSSIGPMDVLYKLFVENEVVLLKMNPVNDYLTHIFSRAFKPLINRNVLRIIEGGAAIGQFLCEHATVDTIHITGSDKTHDAIVYGEGAAGEARKQRHEPANLRKITSELGNVSPVIVVPGPWSSSDILFQAENVVSMLANNAGFNCNAARVLITDRSWDKRGAFLSAIENAFECTPTRRAYYPGAKQRHATFTSNRERVSLLGEPNDGDLPWTLIRDLDPVSDDENCFGTEAFCSLMGETSLTTDSVAAYLAKAVEFVNDRVWGTLNVTVLIHPQTLRDHAIGIAFHQAVADLRFGTVAVNHWAGINFGLVSTTWGAFPGHPQHDIQSGTGVVHNTYMFDRPQKTVLRGPFRPFPKPVWFISHKRTHKVGPALFRFESAPSWWRLPALALNALG